MTLLLDTHVLLWWLADDPRLTRAARDLVADPAHRLMVSAASAWEIAIKSARGKLRIASGWDRALLEQGFEELPIRFAHAREAGALPHLHRDPFDRMLVAQARVEGLCLVTFDPAVRSYPVATLPG